MKRRRTRNIRLTSEKERKKQFIIKSVVKRGSRISWRNIAKWTSRVVKIWVLLALIGGIYWCATTGFRKLFWENPDYALKTIDFKTDGGITYEQVINTAGFVVGRNIFTCKMDAAHDAIAAMPQVETVDLRRYLPNRIELTITERKPVAWVSSATNKPERTDLIDAQGMVFHPKRPLPEYMPLPMISGVPLDDLVPGKPLRVAEVAAALDLLRRMRESGDIQIASIDVSKGYCIVAKDQKGTEITFGLDKLDEGLQRLAKVQRDVAETGQIAKTVNVMVAYNVPVTFMPTPEPKRDADEPLLREPSAKNAPKAKAVEQEPVKQNKVSTPSRKPDPSPGKPRESAPPRENQPLLRPFRRISPA